jgi:D-glycero-D-manno-heptose 1,7-bisphosphate phosphatase
MNKCVFLDRDGVLNEEIGHYVYKLEDLKIPEGTSEAIALLKDAGYLLIVITNQAGIAKGLYSRNEVWACHEKIQAACGNKLDALYYCPYHPDYDSASLARKPDSLLLEKAIAKYQIDTSRSWMIGDRPRDMEAAGKVAVRGIQISPGEKKYPGAQPAKHLLEAARIILSQERD